MSNIISVSRIKSARKPKVCDDCLSPIRKGDSCFRIYGSGEYGDPPYRIYTHLWCYLEDEKATKGVSVRNLHDAAMELYQMVIVSRYKPEFTYNNAYTLELCAKLEERAAKLVADEPESEPTRSILFRSAASLYYQAGYLEKAISCVDEGLRPYTPRMIANEMKCIMEKIAGVPQ